MKFTKLSLAALVAMGIASSASAVENVKVDGQIKLWYQTVETSNSASASLFEQGDFGGTGGATGDLVAKLRATGDLTKKVGFGTTLYAATTLGLENNLVSGEAITVGASNNGQAGTVTNGDANWPVWLGEAYFTYKAGKTIVKIGRQELDTPLAFTETWNAAPNTFEAAVVVNQDIPDTTLVAAYVARGNGNGAGTVGTQFTSYGMAQTVGKSDSGAYAVAMVNKSIPGLTIHPVYYDVVDLAKAYWIDATYDAKILKVGVQGAMLDATGATEDALEAASAGSDKSVSGYAAEISGSVMGVNLAASYSYVDKGPAALAIANTATGIKTKLYTASILSDGRVAAQPDTTSWKLSAGTKVAGFDLGASYGFYSMDKNNYTGGTERTDTTGKRDVTEIDLSVGTKIDDINLNVYYVNQTNFNNAKEDRQAVRVIAAINF